MGDFRVEGLTALPGPNELLCRMRLDLDGILEVTAVEKRTGKAGQITIANALQAKSAEEIAAGRKRIQELYESRGAGDGEEWPETLGDGDNVVEIPAAATTEEEGTDANGEVRDLMDRSRRLLDKMHAEDREEAIDLHERIEAALVSGEPEPLRKASIALRELLFFVEGQG